MKKIVLASLAVAALALPAVANAQTAAAPATATTTMTTTTTAPAAAAPMKWTAADGTVVYSTMKGTDTYVWKADQKTSVGAGTWTVTDASGNKKTLTTDASGKVTGSK